MQTCLWHNCSHSWIHPGFVQIHALQPESLTVQRRLLLRDNRPAPLKGKYDKAYEWIFEAKSNLSGDGYSNPFVMMRLGQSALEIGKTEEAREYLLRAYMFEGEDIFSEEDEKYLNCIRDLINQG